LSRILITTVPFGSENKHPIELLKTQGLDYLINPIGRKLTENELAEMIGDAEVLIAGTEPITKKVMERAKHLKLISRVGIGLDNIDLVSAQQYGIKVSYTPDAPAPAVAELSIGLMLALLRSVQTANLQLHRGEWHRHFGRHVSDVTVGIIGVGRIGKMVLEQISIFKPFRILINDINSKIKLPSSLKCEWVDKDYIYREADLISIHVPLTEITRDLIGHAELLLMKQDAMVVNTARGGIINEKDLVAIMKTGHLNGVAIDVFNQEPYFGELAKIDRVILTSHMGSMTLSCRSRMEIEATEEAIRFLNGQALQQLVPEELYKTQP